MTGKELYIKQYGPTTQVVDAWDGLDLLDQQTYDHIAELITREYINADNWIPVEDELPEDDAKYEDGEYSIGVLIQTEDGDMYVAYLHHKLNMSFWIADSDNYELIEDVTHWQPLPKAREEK